jgi:hypothetical protein
MSARRLDFYLNSADPLRNLTRAARLLSELQHILAKYAPSDLTKHCLVKQLREETLTLTAANAAIASQLRQLTQRLIAGYQKEGAQVTAIHIEVQVRNAVQKRLAEELEASPLRDALNRLAAHGKKAP